MRITLYWADREIYHFEGTIAEKQNKPNKWVYFGEFIGCAPQGLQCNQRYCVKVINARFDDQFCKYPQHREYFELVNFQGDHLRQVLARNPRAEQVGEAILRNKPVQSADHCIVVEPCYELSDPLFEKCAQRSTADRMDIVRQYALGVKELRGHKLWGRSVLCHRDIKRKNGVVEMAGGALRIRLVDYASVRLDQDMGKGISFESAGYVQDGTLGYPMSQSNTAPEDLKTLPYAVSDKTDVYALGMMLAGLFLREGDRFVNPNELWTTTLGWNSDPYEVERRLTEGFTHCADRYERHASGENSWIEQDLAARGKVLCWGPVADQEILGKIRSLFFDATRIDPAKRPSLDAFIDRLEQMIAQAKASKKRIPVSVYLFDQTSFQRYKKAYLQAATDTFQKEQQEVPQALCVSIRKGLPSDQSALEAVTVLTDVPCDGDGLRGVIESIRSGDGTGKDMTVHGLLNACIFFDRYGHTYQFSGRVHIFAPEVPDTARMEPVRGMDIHSFCATITRVYRVQVFICAHTIKAPNAEDDRWYEHVPVSKTTWFPQPQPEPEAEPARETDHPEEDEFYTGDGYCYFWGQDGEKKYVELKKGRWT